MEAKDLVKVSILSTCLQKFKCTCLSKESAILPRDRIVASENARDEGGIVNVQVKTKANIGSSFQETRRHVSFLLDQEEEELPSNYPIIF